MAAWQRNLRVIWITQFLSMVGFSLALPFIPFYVQELGVTDPNAIKHWAAISSSVTAVSLAFMAPIWGALADRYGRKPMMLRAAFSAAVVLALMGMVPNVQMFVVLRFLQGLFTGTINAAQTFVSSESPRDKQGTALGTLSAAIFAGHLAGPSIGGVLAEWVGYRPVFLLGGALMVVSGLLIVFLVREQFVPPEPDPVGMTLTWRGRLAGLGPGAPILVLMVFMAFARVFDGPVLPIYVQEILGRLKGASSVTGMLSAVGAIGAMLAGVFLGRLADRFSPTWIGRLSAVGAGLCMATIGLWGRLGVVFPARFGMAFAAGGLDPVFQIWLSKVTPSRRRGTIFGWAATAKSIGWAIGPLVSGWIAIRYSTRAVFFVGAVVFFALIPLIGHVSRRVLALTTKDSAPAGARPRGRATARRAGGVRHG